MKTVNAFTQATQELENKNIKEAAFGIDLGTTNSGIAVIRAGRSPVMVKLEDGKHIMPSCIMWKGKEFIVGSEAYNNRYKPSAVYSVKRIMGTNEKVVVSYGRKTLTMTPAEVSAEILKGLVSKAKAAGQYSDIKNVVITVPAHFNNRQIEDTKEAGRLAGLNVISTLREPTSAAMAYGLEYETNPNQAVLVYDLGGGTFDVSVLRLYKQDAGDSLGDLYGDDSAESAESMIYTVITTDGDTRLGGDDIDLELYKIFEQKLEDQGVDLSSLQKADREKMILHLETLKKRGVATYTIPTNFRDKNGKKISRKIVITENDFTEATRVIYRKTKKIMDNVVSTVGKENVKDIVLVGGSTKSEIIQKSLKKDFPNAHINSALNPDEAVALGAAVKAKQDFFGDMSVEVFDILPLNIGFISSGYMQPVIKRDTLVPTEQSMGFETETDNQERVRIVILQGNSRLVEDCEVLTEVLISDIPRRPAGEFRGEISLKVDSNGYLTVDVVSEAGEHHVKLNSLFGVSKKAETEVPQDRNFVQWNKFADRLPEGEDKERLKSLLDQYSTVSKKEIVNMIREISNVQIGKKTEKIEDVSDQG